VIYAAFAIAERLDSARSVSDDIFAQRKARLETVWGARVSPMKCFFGGGTMRQHTTPIVVNGDKSVRAERIKLSSGEYDEDWLQDIIAKNPNVLPIEDIEPAYSNQVTLCRELPTGSGFCDVVLINSDGRIVIVECKLWRNPEARRQALSQIIDYAKDISKWPYEQFQENCLRSRRGTAKSLAEIVQEYYPDLDERTFVDVTQRNLSNARFLLLLVGDGIQENAEELVSFLQKFGNMAFTLSMVEIGFYRLPDKQILLTPRVLLKTTEIVRSVIRIDSDGSAVAIPFVPEPTASSVSERSFFEGLAESLGQEIAERFKLLVAEFTSRLGIQARLGRGQRPSLNLKSANDQYNFASVQQNGEVWFYGIVTKTGEVGARDVGVQYLSELAAILNAEVDQSLSEWHWSVRKYGKYLTIDKYLEHADQWMRLVEAVLKQLSEREE
jgi:hypothetical protein